jgi:hypothetical protein
MSTGDMPAMASSNYASTSYAADNISLPTNTAGGHLMRRFDVADHKQFLGAIIPDAVIENASANRPKQGKPKEQTMPRRLVQVFIADPDENLPLDQALLYSGEQKFTDATDQELFFEIDMKSVLTKHNENRVKIVNKKVKDRTEYLEPAKIRDLKMVVVNVATF